MGFPRYEKYKDSGVEWLGEVPEHWGIRATKRMFQLVVDPAANDNDYELLSIYTEIGVRPRKELEAKGNKATTTDGYFKVKKGDLIVNKLLAWMGAIGISDYDGVTSPAYDILRPYKSINPQYYDFLFRCGICFTEFRRFSRGIMDMRLRLYFSEFGQLLMPYPPEIEQIIISKYLLKETAKIDDLIAEQQKLIELLKEKRQAVISHAVTKGLNPDAKMKDSGIEWLGEVPEHWGIKKLKFVFPKLYSGVSVNSENTPTDDNYPGVLKTSCVYGNQFHSEENKKVVEDELDRVACPVTKNSLIISRMNTPELVGNCGYVDRDYPNLYLPDRLWIARFKNSDLFISKFAWFLTTSYTFVELTGLLATGTSGSMKNLSQEAFLNIVVPVPPVDEQKNISAFLDLETSKLDTLISEAQKAITLLQERRTALISAAVTGKIDVRGFVSDSESVVAA